MADLNDLSVSFSRFLSDLEPMQHAMGQAGKKAAHEQIEDDLGGDRSFSGMKRKVRLGAGYDIGEPVVLNMRPKGLVVLADKGRRRTKKITPRRRGGFVALGTPFGVKA